MSSVVYEQVQKLLALASNNPSPHEAESAYRHAQKLIQKHSITDEVLIKEADKLDKRFNPVKELEYIYDYDTSKFATAQGLAEKFKLPQSRVLALISVNSLPVAFMGRKAGARGRMGACYSIADFEVIAFKKLSQNLIVDRMKLDLFLMQHGYVWKEIKNADIVALLRVLGVHPVLEQGASFFFLKQSVLDAAAAIAPLRGKIANPFGLAIRMPD